MPRRDRPRSLHCGREQDDRATLGITNMQICRNVLGFGSFEPIEPSTLKAGQPVIVYCELLGLHYKNSGQSFVTRLSSHVELVDARSNSRSGNSRWARPRTNAEAAAVTTTRTSGSTCPPASSRATIASSLTPDRSGGQPDRLGRASREHRTLSDRGIGLSEWHEWDSAFPLDCAPCQSVRPR